MTARPRQATESTGTAGSIVNGIEAGSDRSPSFSWEEWFGRASAHQRAEAIELAQQQGILYPHQLPHLTNGAKSAVATPESAFVTRLTRILAGKPDVLSSFPSHNLSFFDTELDDLQRQAVIRAISTPDLFMLQGLPGTGKSRVASEIILQAAVRGWRVLFLASHAVSLNVVLQGLTGRQDVFAIRFLDASETSDSLPVSLRGLTLDVQRRALLERLMLGARANRAQAESHCQLRRDQEPIWSELRVCLEQANTLDERLRELRDRLPQLPSLVEQDVLTHESQTPFSQRLIGQRQALEVNGQGLDTTIRARQECVMKIDQQTRELDLHIAALQPAYQAKKNKRLWTWTFWKHWLDDRILHDMEELQGSLAKLQSQRQETVRELKDVQDQRLQLQQCFHAEQARAIRDEIQVRQATLTEEIQTLEQERRKLNERWNGHYQRLALNPTDQSPDALESARQTWMQQRKNDDELCQFARQWIACLDEAGPQLATRLPALANVHAGTMTSWQTDPLFRDAATTPYDLLLIEDADTLTESDLLKAVRQAQRCVLVGRALAESAAISKNIEKSIRPFTPIPLASALCWPRLWRALGGESGLWPYSWFRERGQLICQLLPLAKEDLPYLCSEGLADATEIVLRILHRPKATPRLAQVVFPLSWNFPEAFAFIVREAQEVPIQPAGRSSWWTNESQRCSWRFAPKSVAIHAWLDLEPGIRLATTLNEYGDAVNIAHIEFDKDYAWDQTKAQAWLDRIHPTPDLGRTVFLQSPHRFAMPLAETIVSLVCTHDWLRISPANPTNDKTFEFCAVPPCSPYEWPKAGSGLELDLSAARHAGRLPAELRQGLPAHGFVNYLEAQALVRQLEILHQRETHDSGSAKQIAVLALYESQVELLRRMIEKSEPLRSRTFTLEVTLPSRMHQRECDIVLLSLTRSHPHRSGAYGEDVQELPLALTRARSRLFVFGDPGMLCKRTHWQGPLDHLDAHASHQESVRLSRLFTCVDRLAKAKPMSHALSNGTE